MEDKKIQINIEETGIAEFNNKKHLDNFLNYLFRTDKAQKHTNEITTENIALYNNGDYLGVVRFGDLKSRKEYKGYAWDWIQLYVDKDYKRLCNDIMYFELDNEDDSTVEVDYEDLKDIVKFIVDNKETKEDCLFHVLHIDQKDSPMHIHSVKFKRD